MTRRFTDQEARAIFEQAIEADASNGISEEELIAAAAEVGISQEAVERAIVGMERNQSERDARQAILARRRRGFRKHLGSYLTVNLFLLALNLLVSPDFLWCLFPALGWGLGLVFNAWAALSSEVSERAVRRELRRPERRRKHAVQEVIARDERDREKLRKEQLQQSTKAIGEAVEEGVALMLGKLAQDLRTRTEQRGSRPRVAPERRRVAPEPPHVEPDEAGSDDEEEISPDAPREHARRP